MPVHDSDATAEIAEGNQVLTHNPNRLRQVVDLFGQADRLPATSHELAHRGSRIGTRELRVGRRHRALKIAAIGSVQRVLACGHMV